MSAFDFYKPTDLEAMEVGDSQVETFTFVPTDPAGDPVALIAEPKVVGIARGREVMSLGLGAGLTAGLDGSVTIEVKGAAFGGYRSATLHYSLYREGHVDFRQGVTVRKTHVS